MTGKRAKPASRKPYRGSARRRRHGRRLWASAYPGRVLSFTPILDHHGNVARTVPQPSSGE